MMCEHFTQVRADWNWKSQRMYVLGTSGVRCGKPCFSRHEAGSEPNVIRSGSNTLLQIAVLRRLDTTLAY